MKNAAFIGRFQPFHEGHASVVRKALEVADRLYLLVGSATASRSIRNPFSYEERVALIEERLTPDELARIVIKPIPDFYDDNAWASFVKASVPAGTAVVGHSRDASSYYLAKLFPGWIETGDGSGLTATSIRKDFFGEGRAETPLLEAFKATRGYLDLCEEYHHVKEYKAQFSGLPWPPTFLTADAVVVCDREVLVLRRAGPPGKGLLALPGGFLEQGETLLACAVREAREELGIDLSGIRPAAEATFDWPWRSVRGRVVSRVFRFEMAGKPSLSPSAEETLGAMWLAIDSLRDESMFEDHAHIVRTLSEMAGKGPAGRVSR